MPTNEERRVYRSARKQFHAMSDEQIACRDGNHSFTVPIEASRTRTGAWRRFGCRNGCGAERIQTLTSYGLVVKSRIDYKNAKGYLLVGIGRLTGTAKGAARM